MSASPLRFHRNRHCRRDRSQSGFSFLEVTISVMLVGIVMAGALHTVGAAQRRQREAVDHVIGQQLANALLSEILLMPYQEPDDDATLSFGPESGESIGIRALFDDVDDYHNWTSSPPRDCYGNDMPNLSEWTRGAVVQWADPTSLAVTTSTSTGLKKITVTASKNGRTLGTIVGFRSSAWADAIPEPSDSNSNHSPIAVATSPDPSRKVNEKVDFAGDRSSDPDADYLSYVWDFGDGATATGAKTSHSYTKAGSFTCTLTVYDGRGGIGSASLAVVIQ